MQKPADREAELRKTLKIKKVERRALTRAMQVTNNALKIRRRSHPSQPVTPVPRGL
jgi:hypothetical protein